MKTLILYESKKGFTEDCAVYLSELIPDSEMISMRSFDGNFDDYETVLVGAPIYIGEIAEFAEDFFAINKKKLLKKRLGIFCSGMSISEFNEVMQKSLPYDIFWHAEIVHSGGLLIYEELTSKEKRLLKNRLMLKESAHIDNEHKLSELARWARKYVD